MSKDQDIQGSVVGPHPLSIMGAHPIQWIFAFMMFFFPVFEPEIAKLPLGALFSGLISQAFLVLPGSETPPVLIISRLGLIWAVGVIGWSWISYKYKSYKLCEYALIIESGILTQKSDTIRYQMVFDCDIQRVMGEKSLGIGTLVIRLVNLKNGQPDKRVELGFVKAPETVRDYILARAPRINTVASF